MKHTVVIAAALSLGMLSGCGGEKHDPAAQAPPPAQVENEGGCQPHHRRSPGPFSSSPQPPNISRLPRSTSRARSILIFPGRSRSSRSPPAEWLRFTPHIGASVKKGQLLMEVQSTDISNAFDQYLKAVNDESLARTQDERAKILYEKGAIAKSQLEIAEDGEQDAKADLTAAEQQLIVLGVDKDHPSFTAKVYSPATGVVIAQNVTNAAAAGVTYSGIVHCLYHRRPLPRLGHLRCL